MKVVWTSLIFLFLNYYVVADLKKMSMKSIRIGQLQTTHISNTIYSFVKDLLLSIACFSLNASKSNRPEFNHLECLMCHWIQKCFLFSFNFSSFTIVREFFFLKHLISWNWFFSLFISLITSIPKTGKMRKRERAKEVKSIYHLAFLFLFFSLSVSLCECNECLINWLISYRE